MKRKTLTLTLSILACLALVGVGFASWIISGEDKQDTTGNIVVEQVEDQSVFIQNMVWDSTSNGNLVFGYDSNYSVPDGAWLTVSSDAKAAVMSATLTFDVVNSSGKKVTGMEVSAALVSAESFNTDNKNYVVLEVSDPTENEETWSVTVSFKWGSAFNEKNPLEYYNTTYPNATKDDKLAAKTALEGLYALNGETFTLTLSAKYKASAA